MCAMTDRRTLGSPVEKPGPWTKLKGFGRQVHTAWKLAWDDDRVAHQSEERWLVRQMAFVPVLVRQARLYLLLGGVVLLVHFLFYDNLGSVVRIYAGPRDSQTGKIGAKLEKVLGTSFPDEGPASKFPKLLASLFNGDGYQGEKSWYQLPKWYVNVLQKGDGAASSEKSRRPEAEVKTTEARLKRLVDDPGALVIVQDGFRPSSESQINRLDVRAIADLYDSYLYILVGSNANGGPKVKRIEEIKSTMRMHAGRGVQNEIACEILRAYGIFGASKKDDPRLIMKDYYPLKDQLGDLRNDRVDVVFLLTSPDDLRVAMEQPEDVGSSGLHLLNVDRARAISQVLTYAEVATLPWGTSLLNRVGPGGKAAGMAIPPDSAGITTVKTQTILACSSHMADGVVATILDTIYEDMALGAIVKLPPRPPADQKFNYPMHDASFVFHKGGPQPAFISSPFIVGSLALIIGQIVYIASLMREKKSLTRSRRVVAQVRRLVGNLVLEDLRQPGLAASPDAITQINGLHDLAIIDFAHGRINKESYEKIKEYCQLGVRALTLHDRAVGDMADGKIAKESYDKIKEYCHECFGP